MVQEIKDLIAELEQRLSRCTETTFKIIYKPYEPIGIIPNDLGANWRTIPLMFDIRMICENFGISKNDVEFSEYGIDIFVDDDDFDDDDFWED